MVCPLRWRRFASALVPFLSADYALGGFWLLLTCDVCGCSCPPLGRTQSLVGAFIAAGGAPLSQSQLLEEKRRELLDCHDQLEVAREAEEEYERRLDEEEAKGRRRAHALEVKASKDAVGGSSPTREQIMLRYLYGSQF